MSLKAFQFRPFSQVNHSSTELPQWRIMIFTVQKNPTIPSLISTAFSQYLLAPQIGPLSPHPLSLCPDHCYTPRVVARSLNGHLPFHNAWLTKLTHFCFLFFWMQQLVSQVGVVLAQKGHYFLRQTEGGLEALLTGRTSSHQACHLLQYMLWANLI